MSLKEHVHVFHFFEEKQKMLQLQAKVLCCQESKRMCYSIKEIGGICTNH